MGFRLSQSVTHSRYSKISSTRKVGPSVHRAIPSSEESWSSSVPSRTTGRNVGYTPSVPRVAIKKMFEGNRGRTRASGNNRSTARPAVPGNTGQDSRHCHQEDQKLRSTDLRSSVEQTRRRRSYVGTRRCSEERISPPF